MLGTHTTDPIQCFCFGERAQRLTNFSNLPEQLEGGRGWGERTSGSGRGVPSQADPI